MNKSIIFPLAVVLSLSNLGCKHRPAEIQVKQVNIVLDSLKLKSYADTIVCDMVVKNPDKEDAWMAECLGQLKRKELIDSIFDDIYKGKLIALDFTTHKPLSIQQVKKLEETPGYSRDILGKFQFREAWYYDKAEHSFIKKVQSIVFGFENYDESGFVKGYNPLFKVEF
jgi:hypothetical protein